jgi:cysteine synthase A
VASLRYGSILETIGDTPLVRLDRLAPDLQASVFAKVERFNPGGSIKDRSAISMLIEKVRSGELAPKRSVVIESSSGNLAIGLAQVCRYFRLPLICVVDPRTTAQNIAILKAYRAGIELVETPDPQTGEFLPARMRRVRELVESIPHAYAPDQYSNPLNPRAHEGTMREIAEALDHQVDFLLCAVSTTGTLLGCADYVRQHQLRTTIVAVEPVGSVLFGPGPPLPRRIPGYGAAVRPALFDPTAADKVISVTDLEAVIGCRRLVQREAVLAGGSSGATVAALGKLTSSIPDGARCVLILPDGGDRYLDTIYSDAWVRQQFGEVVHLWEDDEEVAPR